MTCPCCAGQPLSFSEFWEGLNAIRVECRECGQPLKANGITWAWLIACVAVMITFFVFLFAGVEALALEDDIFRVALFGFVFVCAGLSWLTGGYVPVKLRGRSSSMPSLRYSSLLHAPRERVAAFHDDPANLARITPPGIRVTVLEAPEEMKAGASVRLRIRQGPFAVKWESRIVEHSPTSGFVDEQASGPFKRFRHEHRFESEGDATRITDHIDYEVPFGWLGAVVDRLFVARQLRQMLEHRHERTRELLEKEP